VTIRIVLRRGITVLSIVGLTGGLPAAAGWADPEPAPPPGDGAVAVMPVVAAEAPPAPPEGAPPVLDGPVPSSPPVVKEAPDGWTLELAAKDEYQVVVAPLTTALSSREYEVGGIFTGKLTGPEEDEPPHGTLEVGYEIGCGIDMSTSNGVSLTGTMGISPSMGILGLDAAGPLEIGVLPTLGGNLGGGITVGLKPGLVNVVPVTKKEYTGDEPWVMVDRFRVKIDGCVGESFLRSYAYLSRSTDESDAIVAWYGVTKKV